MPRDHVEQALLVAAVGEIPTPCDEVLGEQTQHSLRAEDLLTERDKCQIQIHLLHLLASHLGAKDIGEDGGVMVEVNCQHSSLTCWP